LVKTGTSIFVGYSCDIVITMTVMTDFECIWLYGHFFNYNIELSNGRKCFYLTLSQTVYYTN
jgi:hypothetical protein